MAPETHTLKRVIATRPAGQNDTWCQRIKQLGLKAVACPMLSIEPIQNEDQKEHIKARVAHLAEYDAFIFVSKNAVREAFVWIDQYWPQLPTRMQYFAIGSATQAYLHEQLSRFGCSQAVHSNEQAMDSQGLLKLPALNNSENKRILIFRGQGGLPHLGQALQTRGARVDYCELYQRRLPDDASKNLRALTLSVEHDLLSFFSGDTFQNYIDASKAANLTTPCSARILVPGARVGNMAKALGFERVWQAENASEHAMLSSITKHMGTVKG